MALRINCTTSDFQISLTIFCACIFFISCQSQSQREIAKTLEDFLNSEITIPCNLVPKAYNGLAVDLTSLDAFKRIVVYLNLKDCEDCKIRELIDWDDFMQKHQKSDKLGIVIILHPLDSHATNEFLTRFLFSGTVFYDIDGSFERLNPNLPKDDRFHVFFLNEEHKVVIVGSPIGNEKMEHLYLKEIDN